MAVLAVSVCPAGVYRDFTVFCIVRAMRISGEELTCCVSFWQLNVEFLRHIYVLIDWFTPCIH